MDCARPTDRVPNGLLQDAHFSSCVTTCVRRAQQLDDDIQHLKAILQGDPSTTLHGVQSTRLHRLARIFFLDDDGLLRRYPEPHKVVQPYDELGLLHLGRSLYSAFLVRVLAAIYHYLYGH